MFMNKFINLIFPWWAERMLSTLVIILQRGKEKLSDGIGKLSISMTTFSEISDWLLSEGLGIFSHVEDVKSQEIW